MAYQRKTTYQPVNKKCLFCKDKNQVVDYKDVNTLAKYLNRWNQIESAGRNGNCSKHQRGLTRAIKRARLLALLPFTVR